MFLKSFLRSFSSQLFFFSSAFREFIVGFAFGIGFSMATKASNWQFSAVKICHDLRYFHFQCCTRKSNTFCCTIPNNVNGIKNSKYQFYKGKRKQFSQGVYSFYINQNKKFRAAKNHKRGEGKKFRMELSIGEMSKFSGSIVSFLRSTLSRNFI